MKLNKEESTETAATSAKYTGSEYSHVQVT